MYIIPNKPTEDATTAPVGVLNPERVAAIACPRERATQVTRLLAAAVDTVKALRELRRSTVRELRQQRTAVAEVAVLMGVTPQRVSQLASDGRSHRAVAA